MKKKVLIAGESWFIYMTHVKGFDSFYTSKYEEGVGSLKEAIEANDYEVTYLPNHRVPAEFPLSLAELEEYDCVIFSDMGSNTLLLPNQVFERGQKANNRCELIKEYVNKGGSFMMIGGYMSFSGIDAKSRYGHTAIADILPVECLEVDDRAETPEGATPQVVKEDTRINMPSEWPHFLGYNKTKSIDEGEVLMEINGDPFIAIRECGEGRTAVFTSDCAPHWGSPEFVAWSEYKNIWGELLKYLTKGV